VHAGSHGIIAGTLADAFLLRFHKLTCNWPPAGGKYRPRQTIFLGTDSMGGRAAILLALILGCSISYGEESVNIPLNTVWAHMMPNTRDIKRLQPFFFTEAYANLPSEEYLRLSRESDLRGIIKAIDVRPANGPEAGFAIQGSGAQALTEALAVLTRQKQPRQVFLTGSDISLFFFSYEQGNSVQLKSIERNAKSFIVEYVYVSHMQAEVTEHFALIPAGDLNPGQYTVEMKLGRDAHLLKDPKDGTVCLSFIFTVADQPKE
jgi:hypothetical protein